MRAVAGEALASGDPTGWFERLYLAAETGQAAVPWDRGAPHPLLVEWAASGALDGARGRAVVVGCGPGHDAQYVAGLGFDTIAFDVSPSAVRAAQSRFPGSAVQYLTADVLSPPTSWHRAFDVVVESMTLRPCRTRRVGRRSRTLATSSRPAERSWSSPGHAMPTRIQATDRHWALARAELDASVATGLEPVRIEEIRDEGPPADASLARAVLPPVQAVLPGEPGGAQARYTASCAESQRRSRAGGGRVARGCRVAGSRDMAARPRLTGCRARTKRCAKSCLRVLLRAHPCLPSPQLSSWGVRTFLRGRDHPALPVP